MSLGAVAACLLAISLVDGFDASVGAAAKPRSARVQPFRATAASDVQSARASAPGAGDVSAPAPATAISLASVRASLIRQEETIIFALIERSQFAQNRVIYDPSQWGFDERTDVVLERPSFLDMMLYEVEQVHGRCRRYQSPEELPFFPERVADSVLPALDYPPIIMDDGENINEQLLDAYIDHVVPSCADEGDDRQHGSTALADITCLQALSRRVHFGKFVAESKFVQDRAAFEPLAAAGDVEGMHALLATIAVEDSVVRRAQLKAVTFGQDAISGDDVGFKVDPRSVAALYRDAIIPLTKQVQIRYLLHRLGHADKIPRTLADWPDYLRAFPRANEETGMRARSHDDYTDY